MLERKESDNIWPEGKNPNIKTNKKRKTIQIIHTIHTIVHSTYYIIVCVLRNKSESLRKTNIFKEFMH